MSKIVIAVYVCAAAYPCVAQSFEVASVKLHNTEVTMVGLQNSGPRVTISAFSVENLLEYAFDLKSYQVSGGPTWASADRYDIVAKAPGDSAVTREQIRSMIAALLAERFGITTHREMRDTAVYALVIAKNGPKLKENKDPDAKFSLRMAKPDVAIVVTKGTMEQLVGQLSVNVQRPVLDHTGLTGAYDYELDWRPDYAKGDSDIPSIYTAVEEQLGLKLESIKAPVDVVVIDKVNRPSAD